MGILDSSIGVMIVTVGCLSALILGGVSYIILFVKPKEKEMQEKLNNKKYEEER